MHRAGGGPDQVRLNTTPKERRGKEARERGRDTFKAESPGQEKERGVRKEG